MDTITVRVADPDSNTVALWERHPAHPGGEVWLSGPGEFEVALTPAVDTRLRRGLLLAVEAAAEDEKASARNQGPTRAKGEEPPAGETPPAPNRDEKPPAGHVASGEEPTEEVSVVTQVTGEEAPRSRVQTTKRKGSL